MKMNRLKFCKKFGRATFEAETVFGKRSSFTEALLIILKINYPLIRICKLILRVFIFKGPEEQIYNREKWSRGLKSTKVNLAIKRIITVLGIFTLIQIFPITYFHSTHVFYQLYIL